MSANGFALLLPFLLTPIVSFLFRMVNATISPELIAEFDLGPAELGFVTSAYFVGFGLAQLPLGLLLDRFGPRPVVIGLQMIGAVGGACFVLATGETGLMLGRLMVGVGMAGSVMAGLKAANLWFDRERLPALNSLLFGMSGIGGMLATGPLAMLLKVIDWRSAMLLISAFCCFIALIAVLLIPPAPRPVVRQSLAAQILSIGRLYVSRPFLRYGPVTMATIAGYSAYQSLWAAIWLRDVEGFDRDGQAWALFLLMTTMMLGNFIFAATNARLARVGVTTLQTALTAMGCMVLIQATIALDVLPSSLPLWAAAGFCASGSIAMFAVVSSQFPPDLAGRCNTALNLLGFFGGFLLQSGIGLVLDRFPVAADGRYDPEGHRLALAIAVAIQVAAFTWFFLAGWLARPASRQPPEHPG